MSRGFRPDWTSAPGETIADVLAERSISIESLARRLGKPIRDTHELLEGSRPITIGIARQLSDELGATVSFWMTRDAQFREDSERIESAAWLSALPIKDMTTFGWIRPASNRADRLAACLSFFGVATADEWRDVYYPLIEGSAFRTSRTFESEPASVITWLRQGEIAARNMRCDDWDPKVFSKALPGLRSLTRERDPKVFLPQLQSACARCGVATIFVPPVAGCRASGASRLLNPERALLLLSGRHRTDDHFWFTFFHEAAHLILHGDRLFLEFGVPSTTKEEREADEFAGDVLIPKAHQHEMLRLSANARAVARFARDIGVSPGVVVGQLQHHERIGYQHLNELKRRFSWHVP